MATEFTTAGNEIPRKQTPKPGRVHPPESGFDHFRTSTYVNKAGRKIMLRGVVGDDRPIRSWGLTLIRQGDEEVRKHKDTVVRPRSHRGSVHSPAKVEHFTRSKSALDDQYDSPPVVKPPANHITGEYRVSKRSITQSLRAIRQGKSK